MFVEKQKNGMLVLEKKKLDNENGLLRFEIDDATITVINKVGKHSLYLCEAKKLSIQICQILFCMKNFTLKKASKNFA